MNATPVHSVSSAPVNPGGRLATARGADAARPGAGGSTSRARCMTAGGKPAASLPHTAADERTVRPELAGIRQSPPPAPPAVPSGCFVALRPRLRRLRRVRVRGAAVVVAEATIEAGKGTTAAPVRDGPVSRAPRPKRRRGVAPGAPRGRLRQPPQSRARPMPLASDAVVNGLSGCPGLVPPACPTILRQSLPLRPRILRHRSR